ncbi:hypothetical protein [Tianweitania sediminis]|uniref:Uncharacterized protein n=1 Tax=Tianweitania sediminis TaxID=1502156 RepID=A0A8J7QYG9_9HYPH|nr:hypothetical protein [Tianweitania sediminis]MBP0438275.1 hypothetical protein [Tianweitania sediminis]
MRIRRHSRLLGAMLVFTAFAAEPAVAETVKSGTCVEQEQSQPQGSGSRLSARSSAGSVSTHVEAGNGRVSAGTSLGATQDHEQQVGGAGTQNQQSRRSVTVTSSSGSSASSAVSSSSGNAGTAAVSGSGDCVIISD